MASCVRRGELADRIHRGLLTPGRQIAQTRALQATKVETTLDIEERLARIWREVLDLHGELDRQSNFFDLGGDSLRSLMLYTSIEAQFGQQISAENFFVSPTFADLLRLVAKGNKQSALGPEPSRSAVPWPLPDDMRNKLLVHFESWDGSRPTRDRLVAGLNLAGSKIPLFWVFHERSNLTRLPLCSVLISRSMRSARASVLSNTKRMKYKRLRCAMFLRSKRHVRMGRFSLAGPAKAPSSRWRWRNIAFGVNATCLCWF
jgi:acyl carrier protein